MRLLVRILRVRGICGSMIIGIRCTSSIIRIHAVISIETRVCGAFVRETEVSTKVQDRERVIRALGDDAGYIDPEESTTDRGRVMNYSRRNVKLIAYNAVVRDAILRIHRYAETMSLNLENNSEAKSKFKPTRCLFIAHKIDVCTHQFIIYNYFSICVCRLLFYHLYYFIIFLSVNVKIQSVVEVEKSRAFINILFLTSVRFHLRLGEIYARNVTAFGISTNSLYSRRKVTSG